jgi:hypothetical protein
VYYVQRINYNKEPLDRRQSSRQPQNLSAKSKEEEKGVNAAYAGERMKSAVL